MIKAKFILTGILISTLLIYSCIDTPDAGGDDIQKYIGTWSVSDQSARINYSVIIKANPSNSAEILLENFAGLGGNCVALVIGKSLAIDSQSLNQGYSVVGSGDYINSKKLIINFNLNDGIDNEPRVATFTR